MAFESVQVRSTRAAITVDGYRQDLGTLETVNLQLTSTTGVTSFKWEIIGRPEGSSAGGSGPEPVLLSTSPTASFVTDDDTGFRKDGMYVVQCTVNEGTPSETRIKAGLVRLSTLTLMDGRELRNLGGFETNEDTEDPLVNQGWAKMINRWLQFVHELATSGVPTTTTLAGAYAAGTTAFDQTLALDDSKGGGVVVDGSSGGFSGTNTLKVLGAAGSTLAVRRDLGYVGINVATPLRALHIAGSSSVAARLEAGGISLDILNDGTSLKFNDVSGSTLMAEMIFAGGVRSNFGFGVGTAPPGGKGLAFGDGALLGLSAASTGRIRYNNALTRFETSVSGGAYAPLFVNPLTTKGDLLVHDGTNPVRLPVGTDGFVLTADSTQPDGIKWDVGGGGGFTLRQAYQNGASATAQTLPLTNVGVDGGPVIFDGSVGGYTETTIARFLGATGNTAAFNRLGGLEITHAATAAARTLQSSSTFTTTSGTSGSLLLSGIFDPSSGAGEFRAADIAYTINKTGTANGTVTGLRIAVTETSLGTGGVHDLIKIFGGVSGTSTRLRLTIGGQLVLPEGDASKPAYGGPSGDAGMFFGASGSSIGFTTAGNELEGVRIDADNGLQMRAGNLASAATDGFFYLRSMTDAPTGAPTAVTGAVPVTADSANATMYFYTGAWHALVNAASAATARLSLSNAYNNGDTAGDSTVTLVDGTGKGGITLDGSGGGFTGTNSLSILGPSSAAVNFPRTGGSIRTSDGSSSAPAYSFNGATGMGMYRASAVLKLGVASTDLIAIQSDTVAVTVGGFVRFLVDDSSGIALFSAGSFGGGNKVLSVANATTAPTSDPSGGGILYAESGALKWRGSSGNVTTIATA